MHGYLSWSVHFDSPSRRQDAKIHRLKAVLVGETQSWLPDLVERAQGLKVNGGFEPNTDLLV